LSQLLSIKLIKQDSALQPRAKMDIKIIDEYTEAMKGGASFPALVVYKVDDSYYLVDGYHRFMAAQGAKLANVLCEIRPGTMRDAVLFSAGVNATHGLRRTNEDKRRAVAVLLRDKEWGVWSDTKIATACNVSVDLVATVRKSILGETDRYRRENFQVERGGKVYKMNTTNIGKNHPAAAAPPVTPKDLARKEKFGGNDPVQPPLSAQMAGAVPPKSPVHRPPPCLGGGGCDQKPSLYVRDDRTGRGPVCSAIGAPVDELPGNMCPLADNFERASDGAPSSVAIAAAKSLFGPRPYIIKRDPPSREEVAKHTEQFISELPEQTQEEIDALIKADQEGLFSGDPRELIIELIRERAEQLEVA
jgi:hypothetical protein